MMIIRFRNSEDHEEMLKKVKKMKKFTEELEDCLEEAMEEPDYRTPSYHREYDEDDERYESKRGRYGYNYTRR